MLLSILMVFALTLGTSTYQSDALLADIAPNSGIVQTSDSDRGLNPSITAFGDSLWGFDVEAPTGSVLCLGVEFDGTSFWVTAGGDTLVSDNNMLYRFDSAGTLVNTYTQSSTHSGWGWRDLAWDGTYLYASDSPTVVQIDPATGMATGVTFGGPQNPNRALAYDPATDHFWTANFGSSIYEFDRSGVTINTYANTNPIYGMAWDATSPGGPWLWIAAQTSDQVYQFDPVAGTYTGISFPIPATAGGAAFATDWWDSLGVLFYLAQTTPDRVVAYEIIDVGPVNNVGTSAIVAPGAIEPPSAPMTPEVTFCNTGDFTETFWVFCEVDSSGSNVYSDSSQIVSLLADSCTTVLFSQWTPGDLCNTYDITAYTVLGGDVNSGDDTLTAQTNTFTEVLEIQSGLASASPTFDGTINAGEWSDATVVDVSDVLGMTSSSSVLPCNVDLYVMNDASFLYIAVDYILDSALNVNDRILAYLDDNNDDVWASDTSEGFYRMFNAAGFNSLFLPMPSGPITGPPVPGVSGGVAMGTNVQYEFSIPFGAQTYELNASPATSDTMGFHLVAVDQSILDEEGWWPTSLDISNELDPAFYGDLILALAVPGVEEDISKPSKTRFALYQNEPNPSHSSTTIQYQIPEKGDVKLTVFDITGRVVETLVDKTMDAGVHEVEWEAREASNGIYFYRLTSGNRVATRKMVILK
jgi:hypothetical protein